MKQCVRSEAMILQEAEMHTFREEWEKIETLSEEQISFLLYREGKTVMQIARIRGLSEQTVKQHLLISKKQNAGKNNEQRRLSLLETYLVMSKEQRQEYLGSLSREEEKDLALELLEAANSNCQTEDLMVILWTVGEKKMQTLYSRLKFYCKHPHGNIRRICYSSMGKTGNAEFLPYVVQGFKDKKAQVRQYAVIAFGKLADETQLFMLDSLRRNKSEEAYVLRAAEKAAELLKSKKGNEEMDIEGIQHLISTVE